MAVSRCRRFCPTTKIHTWQSFPSRNMLRGKQEFVELPRLHETPLEPLILFQCWSLKLSSSVHVSFPIPTWPKQQPHFSLHLVNPCPQPQPNDTQRPKSRQAWRNLNWAHSKHSSFNPWGLWLGELIPHPCLIIKIKSFPITSFTSITLISLTFCCTLRRSPCEANGIIIYKASSLWRDGSHFHPQIHTALVFSCMLTYGYRTIYIYLFSIILSNCYNMRYMIYVYIVRLYCT